MKCDLHSLPVIYYFGGLYCSPLHCYFITQQQLGQMARIRRTRRKSVRAIPGLPADIIAAIAEVAVPG